MPSGRGDVVTSVLEAIRAYVRAHPSAADSPAGIQRWWLPPELANVRTADVMTALAMLQSAGELSGLRLPDGNIVYSAALGESAKHSRRGAAGPIKRSGRPSGRCKH